MFRNWENVLCFQCLLVKSLEAKKWPWPLIKTEPRDFWQLSINFWQNYFVNFKVRQGVIVFNSMQKYTLMFRETGCLSFVTDNCVSMREKCKTILSPTPCVCVPFHSQVEMCWQTFRSYWRLQTSLVRFGRKTQKLVHSTTD